MQKLKLMFEATPTGSTKAQFAAAISKGVNMPAAAPPTKGYAAAALAALPSKGVAAAPARPSKGLSAAAMQLPSKGFAAAPPTKGCKLSSVYKVWVCYLV